MEYRIAQDARSTASYYTAHAATEVLKNEVYSTQPGETL